MKKYIVSSFFCVIIFSVTCPSLYAENGRGFNFGVSAGTFPFVWTNNGIRPLNSLCLSGRIGCQVTRHFGIIGELAYSFLSSYAKTTYTFDGGWQSQKINSTTIPLTLSLIYCEPISERFSTYIGVGFGYYQMKYKYFYNQSYGTPQSLIESGEKNAIVPHFGLGSEFLILKKIKIFFEIKKPIGKTRFEGSMYGGGINIERDDHFTGTEVKIGFKYCLRD